MERGDGVIGRGLRMEGRREGEKEGSRIFYGKRVVGRGGDEDGGDPKEENESGVNSRLS